MVFDERPSPARVSAAAAAKLPRVVLLALIFAYIVSGLFGRDPWQEDDATGFGLMWTMAHGGAADWLLPNVAGEIVVEDGPLAFWVGAAAIRLLGNLIGEVSAARVPAILWFLLATAGLWYATLRLARRDEAQPVAFAFGGEATARDYGRMLADVAVLLVIGTIGLVLGLHETTSEPAAFAMMCVAVYGMSLSLDRPYAGAVLTGAALGLLVLARSAQPALWLLLAATLACAGTQTPSIRARAAILLWIVGGIVFALWPLAALTAPDAARVEYFAAWRAAASDALAMPTLDKPAWLVRALPWYTWPLWPFAGWALYAWRHGLKRPHIALPSLILAGQMLGLLTTRALSTEDLVFIVCPLALLGAFGAVSLRSSVENAIDWFAIAAFCVFALALWAYFFAMHAGFPPKMTTSVLRLTSGFVPRLDWGLVAVAMLANGLWLTLVLWRFRRPAGALWRGPMLAATGLITLWITFYSLFVDAVNHRRSFAALAQAVAAEVVRNGDATSCVQAHQLRTSHRAVFAFHGQLRFAGPSDDRCQFALHRDLAASLLDDAPPAGRWTQIWQGHRPGRGDELIRLYVRHD